MMVGRAVELTIEKGPAKPGDEALVVDDLSVIDHSDASASSTT